MSRQQTVNYDRDVRQWYGERIKQANCCYLEYMKKVQKELGENAYGK